MHGARFLGMLSVVIGVAACSSGGGIFQAPKPSGVIEARFVGSDTVLVSSAAAPLIVHNGFSVTLREQNYSAQFSAIIASFTAPTTQSCYIVNVDGTGKVATFTPRTATPIASPPPASNPCTPPSSDVESVLFQDQAGHSLTHYFQNQ